MALTVTMHPLLAERTTLGLGGAALAELAAGCEADLERLPVELARIGGRPFVLGRGSNLLAADGELPVTLVKADLLTGPDVVGEVSTNTPGHDIPGAGGSGKRRIAVRAGAGLRLPKLLAWLAGRGLSGLEGLSGIPGSLGGAVAMNAGSYGVCLGDRLARVRLWTPERGAFWLPRAEISCGYRSFVPALGPEAGGTRGDQLYVVLEAELALDEAAPEAVRAAMREVYAKKKATQPVTARTAGCVFKNPGDGSAGRLLDLCGFKGRRVGGVGFSALHANFLVHHGGGSCAQAMELLEEARCAVWSRFETRLELEVKVVRA